MVALFPRWSNSILRLVLVSVAALVIGVPVLLMAWVRTPLATDQDQPLDQPVEFDHRHHVLDDGIDCRYCHYASERSQYAGIPPTELCLNCHGQLWNESTLLEPVRESFYLDRALEWQRVYRLPEFVFFNHAAHVNRGVGCVSCHGRVDLMPRVHRVNALNMAWCLDCHREPERHLRPQEAITQMDWKPDRPQLEVGRQIKEQRGIRAPVVTCSGCHR